MQLLNYINGELIPPQSNQYLDSINPATGLKINDVPISNEADVENAIVAAENAFANWSNLTAQDRSNYLIAIANEIENSLQELALAEVQDNGKTITQATTVDIPRAAENFKFFAQAIVDFPKESYDNKNYTNEVLRQPLGVVACISPWNLPLYLFTWKIAPALAAGNCVVAKPSEVTPLTAFLLSKICIKIGLPAGVLNILHGNGMFTGNALVTHSKIKAISFTGSTAVGKHIAKLAAESLKKVSLELGGKNPAIVFDDCDFDKTVKELVRASFSNQGEICLCSSKLFIQKNMYEKFKIAFVEQVKNLKVGNPLLAETNVGAIVSEQHFNKIINCIAIAKEEGATILCGGNIIKLDGENANGFFIAPTVLENLPNNCKTNQEEIFGPVVSLMPFENEAEVIHLANENQYGLSATIWSEDLEKANRVASKIDAGVIWINCWLIRDLRTPFGGMKNSGIGREGGNEALRFFTEAKNVCSPLNPLKESCEKFKI
jgi:aminomuconate-semialdehyde/2-hydroxymuconate-6-semialdehyde dehydrogenase